jgi:hypothetical protein
MVIQVFLADDRDPTKIFIKTMNTLEQELSSAGVSVRL